MPRTTRLKNVKLDEISFVGKGDNPEAHVVLLKMKPRSEGAIAKAKKEEVQEDLLKKWMEDNPTLLVKEDGEAVTFDEIQNNRELRDKVWEMCWTLEDSLGSIIRDDSVTDKTAMIQESIDQFKAAITAITKGGQPMSVDVKKQLEQEQAKTAALTKELDEVKAENETLKAKTGTDDEGTCKSCGQKKVTKGADEEDIYKGLPEPVVKRLKEQDAKIAKMEDDGLTREYISKAAEVSLVGPVDTVSAMLKSIAKHDGALVDKVLGILKIANERIKEGDLLKEAGKNDPSGEGSASAYEKIVAKASLLRKEHPELSEAKAFVKVFDEDHELRAAYLKERSEG